MEPASFGARFYGTRYLAAPPLACDDHVAAEFDALLEAARAAGDAPFLTLDQRYPPRLFLRYVAERRGMLLHGLNNPSITEFEPRAGVDYFGSPISAVYATDDGLWPMFFAIGDQQSPRLDVHFPAGAVGFCTRHIREEIEP